MPTLQIDSRAVKVLMATQGITTNEALARMSGFSAETLRRLLNGEEFRSSTLKALASALKCNPLDLLHVEGFPPPHMDAPAIAIAR